jgi:hypothetical protein
MSDCGYDGIRMRVHAARDFITAGLVLIIALGAFSSSSAARALNPVQTARPEPEQEENSLVIATESHLPDASLQTPYQVQLQARGGVVPIRWHLERGALPPGIALDENGLIHGSAEHSGEFQFTVSVKDSGKPQQAVELGFLIAVRAALVLGWKSPAHVSGNRIEGSVQVSNTTPDDIDLTFIALAIAPNGRATAIGYQHFRLPSRTTERELPFSETLPRGGYTIHIDAVGEVPRKGLIYREQLETPSPLQIAAGP